VWQSVVREVPVDLDRRDANWEVEEGNLRISTRFVVRTGIRT
jgi:hypothetical protein